MDIATFIFLLVLAWFALSMNHIFIALVLGISAIFVLLGSYGKGRGVKQEAVEDVQTIVVGGGGSFPTKFDLAIRPDWPKKPVGYWMNLGVASVFEAALKLFEKALGAEEE